MAPAELVDDPELFLANKAPGLRLHIGRQAGPTWTVIPEAAHRPIGVDHVAVAPGGLPQQQQPLSGRLPACPSAADAEPSRPATGDHADRLVVRRATRSRMSAPELVRLASQWPSSSDISAAPNLFTLAWRLTPRMAASSAWLYP